MRITTLGLFCCTFAITGCSFGRFVQTRVPNSCGGGATGYAIAGITYGDARIAVIPVINLRRGAEFRVKLIPQGDDLFGMSPRELEVTVEGDVDNDPDSAWIAPRTETFNSTAENGGFMPPLCVPDDQELADYKYKITVELVGILDPRARVR